MVFQKERRDDLILPSSLKINQILNPLFDLLLPRLCAACNKKLSIDEESLCSECLGNIEYTNESLLKIQFNNHFCSTDVSGIYAMLIFRNDGITHKLIHSFKYGGSFRNAEFSGKLLGKSLISKHPFTDTDIIVPVPLHRLKKYERGYNQSDYIAKGITQVTGIPGKRNLLKRIRNTKTQTRLNKDERINNVKDAFKAFRQSEVSDKTILLVDDVMTTGSTLAEAARTLKAAGCKKVYAATVAVAEKLNL